MPIRVQRNIRRIKRNNVKITQWFLDPVKTMVLIIQITKREFWKKLNYRYNFFNYNPNSLDFNIPKFFIPNPCDQSFETLSNYQKECDNDLFFAMSHGVHRGELKKGKKMIDRNIYKQTYKIKLKNDKFDIYGLR